MLEASSNYNEDKLDKQKFVNIVFLEIRLEEINKRTVCWSSTSKKDLDKKQTKTMEMSVREKKDKGKWKREKRRIEAKEVEKMSV